MVEAIIFDWDGVISDSYKLQVEAEQTAARIMADEQGIELDIDGIDWDKYQGWGRVKIAADLFGVEPKDDLAEAYRERVVDATVEVMTPHNLDVIEGVRPFLDYMRLRIGKLGVATSSNRWILDASLELFDMQDYFKETVAHRECVDDKPKPGQYREVMRRLDVEPRNTLVIEDSASGITAGRAAGAIVLAISTTKPPEYLRASTDANLVAEDFNYAAYLLQPYMR